MYIFFHLETTLWNYGKDRIEYMEYMEFFLHMEYPKFAQKVSVNNEGNYKQGEKTALRLGENNSKRSNRQRINLKNIQAAPAAQLQKNK